MSRRTWMPILVVAGVALVAIWTRSRVGPPSEVEAPPSDGRPIAGTALSGEVTGRVRMDGSETPLAGAIVTFDLASTADPVDVTRTADERGSFSCVLEPGIWRVTAVDERAVSRREPLRIVVEAGRAPLRPLEIRMDAGVRIVGVVRSRETGDPIEDAIVELRPNAAFAAAEDIDRDIVYPGGRRSTRTDRAGRFVVDALELGSHRLDVSARGRLREAVEHFVVDARGEASIEIELERGAAVFGRVRDVDGRPVSGAKVWLRVAHVGGADRRRIFETETETGGDGAYRLEGLVSQWPYIVIAESEGKAPAWKGEFTFEAIGEEREIDLVLRTGSVISGRVIDADGAPVPGALVSCRDDVPAVWCSGPGQVPPEYLAIGELDTRSASSDAEGRFEFRHLGGSTHAIEAEKEGHPRGFERVYRTKDRVDLVVRLEETPRSDEPETPDGTWALWIPWPWSSR